MFFTFLTLYVRLFLERQDSEVTIVVWGYLNPNHPNHNYTITVPRKAKYFCDKLLTLDNKKTLYKWSCFKAKEPHYQTLVISYTHLSMRFEEIETCSWHVRRSLTTCLDRCLLWCIHQKYLLLHPFNDDHVSSSKEHTAVGRRNMMKNSVTNFASIEHDSKSDHLWIDIVYRSSIWAISPI